MLPGLRRLRDRYDAVLLDLDGTLLDGESRLGERTRRAVARLVDAGFLVVICTGRSVAGARPHWQALGLDNPVVAYNGSWIGHPDGEPEHYIPIPDEHLAPIFGVACGAHFSFRHRAEWKYTVMTDHPEHGLVASWFENVVRAPVPSELPAQDILRVSMFFEGRALPPGGEREALWQRIPDPSRAALRAEAFPLSMFPKYGGSTLHLFEVQGQSNGKAEAFDWLRARHGIPPERTIAVGDHMNDLTMLEGAGLSVAPRSAVPQARALADLLVGHHAEEGFAAWVDDGAPVDAASVRAPGPAA